MEVQAAQLLETAASLLNGVIIGHGGTAGGANLGISDILYLLNLYTTKMARPISTTDTSIMTAVLLWTPSLASTRGALKEKA